MTLKKLSQHLLLATAFSLGAAHAANAASFVDEFDGGELAGHWEVLNEDQDSYVVEDGNLLALATGGASLSKGTASNIFRLKTPLPKGNWVATMKFRMPYQTGREAPFLGLYGDKDNFFAAYANAWSYYEKVRGARLFSNSTKEIKGKAIYFSNVIWGGAGGKAFTADDAPNPFILRVTKTGRNYSAAVQINEGGEPSWKEFQSVTLLREPGSLAFGILQQEKVAGETPMFVDWIRIDPAN
ncbi:MAG: hypothetical protein AAF441_08150 [Pseudomonadota bacterium]